MDTPTAPVIHITRAQPVSTHTNHTTHTAQTKQQSSQPWSSPSLVPVYTHTPVSTDTIIHTTHNQSALTHTNCTHLTIQLSLSLLHTHNQSAFTQTTEHSLIHTLHRLNSANLNHTALGLSRPQAHTQNTSRYTHAHNYTRNTQPVSTHTHKQHSSRHTPYSPLSLTHTQSGRRTDKVKCRRKVVVIKNMTPTVAERQHKNGEKSIQAQMVKNPLKQKWWKN